MAILCAWAAWDENHNARCGKKGDQTGGEVHTGPWWYFGQNCVIRPKTAALADKIADVMKTLADNDLVGYDQGNRTSLYNELKKINFKYDQLAVKCECDCSALVAAAVNCAGVRISPNAWTGNLWDCLRETGKFTRLTGATYTTTDVNLKRGDIVLNEQSHVIVALQDGENEKAKVSGFSTSGVVAPKSIVRGDRFKIAGKIKSNAPLVSVEVGVMTKPGNKWVPTCHVVKSVAGHAYNLANADPEIAFRKLPAGTYYYRVYARDKNGEKKRLINRTFNVVAQRAKKTLKAIAQEIYTGKCSFNGYATWGTGATRKARLKEAGYTAAEIKEIQALVDGMF